jgi:pyruvate,orthophosphate dikinase
MIGIPRAAMTADEIATAAKFFSFGTNNLTRSPSASSGTMRRGFRPVPFETVQKDPAREIPFAKYAGGF